MKNAVIDLPPSITLLIDLHGVALDSTAIHRLLEPVFFPASYDSGITDRLARGKKVVFANPDPSTLLGITQCLEFVHTHCLVIPDTHVQPWGLLYAGQLDVRLRELLDQVRRHETTSVSRLLSEESSRRSTKEGIGGGRISEDGSDPKLVSSRAMSRIASDLKDLYDYGLVNRSRVKIGGQDKETYRYSLYHPYQHVAPEYLPAVLSFHRMPRPPRTKVQSTRRGNGVTLDDPEPAPRHVPRETFSSGYDAGEAARLFAVRWLHCEEEIEHLTREEKHKMHGRLSSLREDAACQPAQQGLRTSELGRVVYSQGILSPQDDAWRQAEECFVQSLTLGEQAGDACLASRARQGLAQIFAARSEYAQALGHYAHGYEQAAALDFPHELARISL